jgi:HEAT repeat protein
MPSRQRDLMEAEDMDRISALIRLLDDPEDADALEVAFGEPEPLDIDDDLLPHEDDQPFLFRELVCTELGEVGPEAAEAPPALLRCVEDETDNTCARFMRLAAAEAIWRITHEPALEIWERLLGDRECWFRRQVVEFLEEAGHAATLDLLRERQLQDSRPEVREAAARAIAKIEAGS